MDEGWGRLRRPGTEHEHGWGRLRRPGAEHEHVWGRLHRPWWRNHTAIEYGLNVYWVGTYVALGGVATSSPNVGGTQI